MTNNKRELTGLYEAYWEIGTQICEREGHEWMEVDHVVEDQSSSAKLWNQSPVERCTRCNRTRFSLDASTSMNMESHTIFEGVHNG